MENVSVEIDKREIYLMLRYGYPFDQIRDVIEPLKDIEGVHKVSLDKFFLEYLVADLCRSIREVKSRGLQLEIDELCDNLEMFLRDAAMSMDI